MYLDTLIQNKQSYLPNKVNIDLHQLEATPLHMNQESLRAASS